MALSDESKACSRPYGRAIAAVALGLAITVGGAWALGPTIGDAHADSRETLAQLRQDVSAKSQAYNEAMEATAQAQADVEDCRARIADIEARIPGAQEKAASAMVTQYKFSQNSAGLLNVILSSDGFENFVATLTYLNTVQTYTSGQLEGLLELQDELEQERANLESLLVEAQQAEDEAAEALAQVQAAADEAEARVAEEEAARQAALAAQAAASRDQSTVTTETDPSTGETIFIETKPDGSTERVDEDRADEIINSGQTATRALLSRAVRPPSPNLIPSLLSLAVPPATRRLIRGLPASTPTLPVPHCRATAVSLPRPPLPTASTLAGHRLFLASSRRWARTASGRTTPGAGWATASQAGKRPSGLTLSISATCTVASSPWMLPTSTAIPARSGTTPCWGRWKASRQLGHDASQTGPTSVISLVLAAHSAAAGSLDGRRGPLLYRARSWQGGLRGCFAFPLIPPARNPRALRQVSMARAGLRGLVLSESAAAIFAARTSEKQTPSGPQLTPSHYQSPHTAAH